ncbi:dipeptidyl-peptidase 3 family protein [Brumimicrobium oceani]|uniref:Dihydrofolate reductase n=1 Tax=Brumimicrobium oceani TaxID=2100725 RepID=A0A2U2XB85_9FLAO|nr:dihydrofolate reductase [Brumimicrobium oceani]PWH85020.1 dihydrofolate reductase [Brumimicrobium oceani]
MKKTINSRLVVGAIAAGVLFSCGQNESQTKTEKEPVEQTEKQDNEAFEWEADRFADIRVLRYKINGFDKLTLDQKKLAYYLTQAGLSGRDIIYDQNYKHNLEIRKALDHIVANHEGEESENWNKFLQYTKQVWFANGIHHHYSKDKFQPEFDKEYFNTLLAETDTKLSDEALEAIFDPNVDAKGVNLDASKGIIKGSANNFYGEGVTEKMVDEYYAKIKDPNDKTPISYGLNSKMILNDNGELEEVTWKIGGMYGPALEKVAYWLEKAAEVAENDAQRDALKLLVKYYETGDLKDWDAYSIAWVEATDGDIDYINGFIEVYGDAKGYRATYETIVQMKDFEASEQMKVLEENVQWFEDNSSIMDEHKKANVKGVTYKVVNVIGEAGDASPSTPIGVNLPNADWIRAEHGSKSVSLGNIVEAYENAAGGSMLKEFTYDDEELERAKKYGAKASRLHTSLHEVVGHASGQLNPGVGTPKETLKNYASALEEARADLVSLYFLMDEKLIEYGLVESLEVGKAEYDAYLRNGLMTQLQRVELGKNIEQSHMRNRQLVASWVYEKGKENNVIEKIQEDGKTYFKIRDYKALQALFGELLREIQRIKSEGDFEAGKNLIETYAVNINQEIHAEVLERVKPMNIPPYSGFVNPVLVPEMDEDGNITDIKINYVSSFKEQMLEYAKEYSFLK